MSAPAANAPRGVFLIYARAANDVIGADGTLPWHIPADLAHFKRLTMGHPMVMGRRTFESLPGLLPGRPHIVLTRDPEWQAEGVETAASLPAALALAARHAAGGPIAVIGGAGVFTAALPLAERVELTEIHRDYIGDVTMPALGAQWQETARADRPARGAQPAFSFVTLVRR